MNVDTDCGASLELTLETCLDDFEMRLGERTKVPSDRLDEFLEWPEGKLKQEAAVVERVLRRFADAVVSSMENPASTDEFLRALDLKAISRDHDWRAIFSTMRGEANGYEDYKRAVLIKYLQYLSFRKRLLQYIYSRKQGLEETDSYSDLTVYPAAAGTDGADGRFERVPLGETVTVELLEGKSVELMLAGHLFRLVGSSTTPCLIDQNGVMYYLREGRNMVGRHPESDIVVDLNLASISRAHMVLEWRGRSRIMITDLSTKGTSLRTDQLGAARRRRS